MKATRAVLPADRGLIGFVGGPWTLFVYAVEGTHAGTLATREDVACHSIASLRGDWCRCCERGIASQLAAGADVVMVFDTAAGELPPMSFDASSRRTSSGWRGGFPGSSATSAGICIRRIWRAASIADGAVGGPRRTTGAGISPRVWPPAARRLRAGQLRPRAAAAHWSCARPGDRRVPRADGPAAGARPSRLDLRARSWRPAGDAGSQRPPVRSAGTEEVAMTAVRSRGPVRRAGAAVHELSARAALARHADGGAVGRFPRPRHRRARCVAGALRAHPVLRVVVHVLRLQHGDHPRPPARGLPTSISCSRELDGYRARVPALDARPLRQLHLGGGTPTFSRRPRSTA